jgi:hypothetical protein
MALGDFSTDEEGFGKIAIPFMWILFIFSTVLNMIIMLNLLIAIISESFANINSVAKQASYRERANIISENLYLVPKKQRKNYCEHNSYLLMAIDTEQELAEHQETIDMKLIALRNRITETNDKQFAKIKKRMKKQHNEILKLLGAGSTLSMLGGSMGRNSIIDSKY